MTQEDSTKGGIRSFTVPEGAINVRADKVLSALVEGTHSRTSLQQFLDENRVTRSGIAIGKKTPVNTGDVLEVDFPDATPTPLRGMDIPVEIVFEDKDLLVINKRAGQVVHPGIGTDEDTLVHALLHHTEGGLSLAAGEARPGVVHRLDKETSGLIIFAKTDVAYLALIKAFSERTVKKEYVAWVLKVPNLLGGSIKTPIGRSTSNRTKMAVEEKGKPAHTDWSVEKAYGKDYARLRCFLYTGRTHQIRVHLSSIGHPILGDATYGYRPYPKNPVDVPRVMLHAEKLSFSHPVTGNLMEFKAPWPEDMVALDKRLSE
jgi:23S rRNA pseudouridine1911/1915/1917 synthase